MAKLTPEEMRDNFLTRQLFEAVSNNNTKQMDVCLDKGANIDGFDSMGRTPLTYVMSMYDEFRVPMIKHILERGADIYALQEDGKSVFDIANALSTLTLRRAANALLLELLPNEAPKAEGLKQEFDSMASDKAISVGGHLVLKTPSPKPKTP